MIMRLDYEFELNGKKYEGCGVDIGDTDDLEKESKDTKGLKIAAICHAFNITIDEYEERKPEFENVKFNYCTLRI